MTAGPVLVASAPRRISGDRQLVDFSRRDDGHLKGWWRYLNVRGEALFEVGNICDTCQYWFQRLEPDVAPIDIDAMSGILADGLRTLDEEVVEAFGRILPEGDYRVALLRLTPERISPGSAADYFRTEQPADWPQILMPDEEPDLLDPATDYYRPAGQSGFTIAGDPAFDFLVPLQRPECLDEERIAYFAERLAGGAAPTAVAVGLFDIKQHYASEVAHWCLGHFLLDGHHKVEAAARTGRPVTLLSFISCAASLSIPEYLDRRLAAYAREAEPTH